MTVLGKRLRRWLYLGHRWLGILTCLLFAVWFVSGVVMMYVGFPRLTDAERRAALPGIAWDRVVLAPEQALARAGLAEGDVSRLTLSMLDGAPVYRLVPWEGARRTVSAVDGRAPAPLDAQRAVAVAAHHPAARAPVWLGEVERDQWSVHQRLDPLRPFQRVALGDAAGTELYLSRATGEIALDTTRHERVWNWFGAIPHWIYVTPLRAEVDLWRAVVLWLSGIGIAGAATGMVVGTIRVRVRRRYKGGALTPYRGIMGWHHIGGLVAGTAVVTFIVSGWFSMNPNRWFSPHEADRTAMAGYAGPAGAPFPLQRAGLAAACAEAREARFLRVGGRPRIALACATGSVRGGRAVVDGPERMAETDLIAAAAGLMPGEAPPRIERIAQEDLYWYAHHHERVLPVLRVVFSDPAATWFHLDPVTGEVLGRMDRSTRAWRWLYNGLHTLDFPVLFRLRPLWDAVMLLLCAGGLLVAVSGIVVGWRRLARGL